MNFLLVLTIALISNLSPSRCKFQAEAVLSRLRTGSSRDWDALGDCVVNLVLSQSSWRLVVFTDHSRQKVRFWLLYSRQSGRTVFELKKEDLNLTSPPYTVPLELRPLILSIRRSLARKLH